MRTLALGALVVDLQARQARRAGSPAIDLTAQEVALLHALAARAGAAVPREVLFREVLGYSDAAAGRSRALDATVRRLRKKLELDPERPAVLLTDHGKGFRLVGLGSTGEVAAVEPPNGATFGPDEPLLAALAGLERAPAVVTLVGPGGVGKSRLARRVVGASPVGVWAWAALDRPVDADWIATAVAAALGLPASVQGTEALLVAVRDAPAAGVVLDRAEVAVDGVAQLASRWAKALPDRPWIATSRTPLGIGAETCVTVAPLGSDDAVALLLHRAKAWLGGRDWAAPDDPAVRELVQRLDGLPLALELAAARAVVLGPQELCQRLHDPAVLSAPVRGADPRHGSLDRMLEASWSALSDAERQALAALTVFHGPFPLEAAERVAGSFAVVDALVRQNLLRPRSASGRLANYDTVRTFVARRGDIAGRTEVDRRYARCAVLDGVAHRDRLVAARLGLRLGELSTEAAVDAVLRAAPSPHDPPLTVAELLAFASELAMAHPGCVRAVVAGADIATRQSDRAQVDAWLDRLDDAVGRAEVTGPVAARVAIAWAGLAAAAGRAAEAAERVQPWVGDTPEGIFAAITLAGALSRLGRSDEAAGWVEPVTERPVCRAQAASFDVPSGTELKGRAEMLSATVRMHRGELDEAHRLLERALGRWQAAGDRRGVAVAIGALGLVAHRRGQLDLAVHQYRLAIAAGRASGELRVCASCAANLALIAVARGDDDAIERLQDTVDLHVALDSGQERLLALANRHGAVPAPLRDRRAAAATLEALAAEAGGRSMHNVAALAHKYRALQLREVDAAAALAAADEAVAAATGAMRLEVLGVRGAVAAAAGALDRAAADLATLAAADRSAVTGLAAVDLALHTAEIAAAVGDRTEADRALAEAEQRLVAVRLPPEAPLVRRAAALRGALDVPTGSIRRIAHDAP